MCIFALRKSQLSIINKEKQKSTFKKGSSCSFHRYHLHKNSCALDPKSEAPVQWYRSAHTNQVIVSSVHVNHAIVSHQDDFKGKRSNKAEFTLDNAEVLYLTP